MRRKKFRTLLCGCLLLLRSAFPPGRGLMNFDVLGLPRSLAFPGNDFKPDFLSIVEGSKTISLYQDGRKVDEYVNLASTIGRAGDESVPLLRVEPFHRPYGNFRVENFFGGRP